DGDQSEDDEDNASIPTPQISDLSLTKTVSDASPNVGDTVTFSLVINNDGPNAATGVDVEDVVPVGYSGLTNSNTVGGVTGMIATNIVSWTGLSIPNGGSITLTFDAVVDAPTGVVDEYLNTAQITDSDQYDPDSDPASDNTVDDLGDLRGDDDEDSAVVVPQEADLSIVKEIDNTSPNVGETVTFTVTVTNGGPNIATGISVVDILPVGYTLTGVSGTGANLPFSADTASWSGISIPANNGEVVLTYTATVNAPTGAAGEYSNSAQITVSDQYDPDSTVNNNVPSEDDQDNVTIVPLT
ncbi:DUF11 domain-containing protein, partial [Kordia jejudonensis]|uniref:DUF11 domain-containing protein n=1 Tax=Kordia jejudonensis TaxID=1348245 RepID=UPI0006293D6B